MLICEHKDLSASYSVFAESPEMVLEENLAGTGHQSPGSFLPHPILSPRHVEGHPGTFFLSQEATSWCATFRDIVFVVPSARDLSLSGSGFISKATSPRQERQPSS